MVSVGVQNTCSQPDTFQAKLRIMRKEGDPQLARWAKSAPPKLMPQISSQATGSGNGWWVGVHPSLSEPRTHAPRGIFVMDHRSLGLARALLWLQFTHGPLGLKSV